MNTAIAALRDNGIILCAAAGNETVNNDVTPSYPANYNVSNIISVASINQTNGLSSFSNYGATTVDLAAPGSNIYSTLPQHLATTQSSVMAGAANYSSKQLVYSGTTGLSGISGSIHACGLGNPGDFPPAVSGNIALIQRGTITFADKITNAKNAGAVAAIVYDNLTDPITTGSWTLGGVGSWIPAVRVTKANGESILAGLPASGNRGELPRSHLHLSVSQRHIDGHTTCRGRGGFRGVEFPGGNHGPENRPHHGQRHTRRRARRKDDNRGTP